MLAAHLQATPPRPPPLQFQAPSSGVLTLHLERSERTGNSPQQPAPGSPDRSRDKPESFFRLCCSVALCSAAYICWRLARAAHALHAVHARPTHTAHSVAHTRHATPPGPPPPRPPSHRSSSVATRSRSDRDCRAGAGAGGWLVGAQLSGSGLGCRSLGAPLWAVAPGSCGAPPYARVLCMYLCVCACVCGVWRVQQCVQCRGVQ
jgi:hypothetical protein